MTTAETMLAVSVMMGGLIFILIFALWRNGIIK